MVLRIECSAKKPARTQSRGSLCEIPSTMRQIVIFLVLICNYAVGQIPNDYDYPLAKRLKGVSRVINKNRPNSKWIESFDSSGYMIESIYYYRRKIRSHVKFEYKFEGNKVIMY